MWYVAVTRLQCEARVAGDLARIGVATYIPMGAIVVKRRRGGRTIERVLFPGYLFADSHSFDRRWIEGLYGFISNAGAPVKIGASVVDQLRDRIARGEFDARRRSWIIPGMKVEILDGPFKWAAGQVETSTARRANVLIELLSRRVSVSIAIDQLLEVT